MLFNTQKNDSQSLRPTKASFNTGFEAGPICPELYVMELGQWFRNPLSEYS